MEKVSDEALQDLAKLGVSPQEIAKVAPRAAQRSRNITIIVEPQNCDAVQLWRFMHTQWNTDTQVIGKHLVVLRTSLKYEALPAIAAGLKIVPDDYTMEAIKQMADEAMEIHGERLRDQLSRS